MSYIVVLIGSTSLLYDFLPSQSTNEISLTFEVVWKFSSNLSHHPSKTFSTCFSRRNVPISLTGGCVENHHEIISDKMSRIWWKLNNIF